MKAILMSSVLMLSACDVGNATRGVTAGVVGTTVEATKGMADGVKSGFQEGRKGATSLDGATVLSTAPEIAASTQVAVHELLPTDSGVEVVLAVENTTGVPIHLIGLTNEGGALLIDEEGFALGLAQGIVVGDIAIPPHAKVRARLHFQGNAETARFVRVWGQELAVPK